MKTIARFATLVASLACISTAASADLDCNDAGPQTPRDISFTAGENMTQFAWAPQYTEMNLCNIHTHTNAEHKGPDFSIKVGSGEHGGYACNEQAR